MTTEFKRTAGDETVDPEITLVVGGAPSRVAIQDCTDYCGGYSVNLYSPDGESFWMENCGTFRSLRQAKRRALAVWQTRVAC